MTDNSAYIRNEIMKRKNAGQSNSKQSNTSKNNGLIEDILIGLILLMTIPLGWAFIQKIDIGPSKETPIVVEHSKEDKESSLSIQVQELKEKVKLWTHRTWMLSIAVNENAWLNKDIETKTHDNPNSGFIYVENDWSLSDYPEHVDISPDMRDRIDVK